MTEALGPDELAYYGDGAFYDAEYVHIRSDIPFYESIAAAGEGPILELAAGTGRLTIPMALASRHDVVGIDVAPAMIEEANKKRGLLDESVRARLRFEVADMRHARLGTSFDTIVLAFNTLMHLLDDGDVDACLSTAREHLSEKGLFHLDVLNPHGGLVTSRDRESRYDPQQMIDPRTGSRYVVTENNAYDPRTQINVLTFYYRRADRDGRPMGDELKRSVRLRVFYPRELELLIRRAGLEIAGDFDDFSKNPFSARGGRRILALRRAR
ncbi:MAG: class I SAM-dependent methyltransferase [Deltaproteobacteria bacterium]|nr:class I SAM-dependent methyltransferase [Deltaproteobacteria bacterium]